MPSGHSTLVLVLVFFSSVAFAQNPNSSLPRWPVLIDPVCPVSSLYARPFPNATKQMRVLYFPAAKEAKLKNPESLRLNVGFDMPSSAGRPIVPDTGNIPFTRNGDYWEAILPLEKQHTAYAIFAVQDDKSGNVDDNNGQLWDVVFCDPVGKKDTNGVLHEAQSYTDASWSPTLYRTRDYNKAISILENYLGQDSSANSSFFLLPNLWEYKAERDGSNAQAYAKLSKELDQYLAEHRDEKRAAGTVGNFVVRHQDQLPAEFVERIISTLDAKRNDPKHSLRADVTYTRAVKETDSRKRLAELDAFVANYPQAIQVQLAQESRFYTLVELKDVHGAEGTLASYSLARARDRDLIDPNSANLYLAMAQLYVEQAEKLDTALKLADEAQETVKADQPHGMTLPPEFKQNLEARCAEMRARAYIALDQPSQAVAEADKALPVLKESAEAHFVMAQAYGLTSEKQKALDEYFDAALMPSNDDLKYRAELERFYRKNFGSAKKYQAALNKRIADRFQAANYVPKLLDQPAPVLELTTLKGEKFDSKELSGKTVVLNFWSPG